MANAIVRVGETFLLRQLAPGTIRCSGPSCTKRQGPGPVFHYWWSDDQGTAPPDTTDAYCSTTCWQAHQHGPAPLPRRRRWAEEFPPGQYNITGEPIA